MSDSESAIETSDPVENGLFTADDEERWKELHEQPLEELSDAEVTSKIRLSVRRRYDYPEWILMFEYGAPGSEGSVCDCLAVNTFPSRNYKVIGFEFKASRSDWLREVRDGQKADYFVRLADEFYVVAPKGVVEDSEIPDGWGYLELKPNSEQLYKLQDSDLTEHQQGEPGRRFWIRFLEQTMGRESNYSEQDLREARSRGYDDAKADGIDDRELDRNLDRLRTKADSYERLQEEFDFLPWRDFDEKDAETLGLAVSLIRAVDSDGFGSIRGTLEHFEDDIDRQAERMQESIDELKQGFQSLEDRVFDSDPLHGGEDSSDGGNSR